MTATAKSIAKSRTSEKTSVDGKAEVAKGVVGSLGVAGAGIALWSVASLIGALVASGGPIALVKAWFGAISGQ